MHCSRGKSFSEEMGPFLGFIPGTFVRARIGSYGLRTYKQLRKGCQWYRGFLWQRGSTKRGLHNMLLLWNSTVDKMPLEWELLDVKHGISEAVNSFANKHPVQDVSGFRAGHILICLTWQGGKGDYIISFATLPCSECRSRRENEHRRYSLTIRDTVQTCTLRYRHGTYHTYSSWV